MWPSSCSHWGAFTQLTGLWLPSCPFLAASWAHLMHPLCASLPSVVPLSQLSCLDSCPGTSFQNHMAVSSGQSPQSLEQVYPVTSAFGNYYSAQYSPFSNEVHLGKCFSLVLSSWSTTLTRCSAGCCPVPHLQCALRL